jgi:hypothetical protein
MMGGPGQPRGPDAQAPDAHGPGRGGGGRVTSHRDGVTEPEPGPGSG